MNLVAQLLSLAMAVLVARTLGPTQRAHYALPLALAVVVWAVCHLSLDSSAGRLISRHEATIAQVTEFLSAAVLILSGTSVGFIMLIGTATGHALLHDPSSTTLLLAALTIPCQLAQQMELAILARVGRFRALGTVPVATIAAQFIGVGVLAIDRQLTPNTLLAATVLANGIGAVAWAVVIARAIGAAHLVPRVDLRIARLALANGIAIHPATLGLQLVTTVDLLVVGAFTSTRSTGLYSLSVTLANNVYFVSGLLAGAAMYKQTLYDTNSAINYTLDFARQTLLFGIGEFALAAVCAYPFVTLLYGSLWSGSVAPFVVLVVAGLAFTVETPVRTLLMRVASPWRISALALAELALNVVLTIVLIGPLGILGAAFASAVAYWIYVTGVLLLMRRTTGRAVAGLFRPPRRQDPVVGRLLSLRSHIRPLRDRDSSTSD